MSNKTNEVVLSTRRRWSDEEKRIILAEIGGGVSVTEVARRRGLSRELLFRWRREACKRVDLANEHTGFIPLSLPAPQSGKGAGIEVVLASGARLIVGERTDLALLKRVMVALG
jgi:transposase